MFQQLTTAGVLSENVSQQTAKRLPAEQLRQRLGLRLRPIFAILCHHASVEEGHIQPHLCSSEGCVCDAALVVSTVAIGEVS